MKKTLSLIIIVIMSVLFLPMTQAVTYSETISSVVYIEAMDSNSEYFGGTGVLISNDALILTAAHVIIDENTGLPAETINLCFIDTEFDIPTCTHSAGVLSYDEEIDLALLYPEYALDANGNQIGDALTPEDAQALYLPYTDFADSNPSLGDPISIFGYPAAIKSPTITLTQGTISSFIPLDENLIWYFTTDATINPGNSGGPVYNADERIIGIVSAVSTEGIGGNYGYIISSDIVILWFFDLIDQGILNEQFVFETFNNDYLTTVENIDYEDFYIFTDVNINTQNAEAIAYLKNHGIVHGYPDGSFKPLDNLNRAELLKILIEGSGDSPDAQLYQECFPDVHDEWFARYVCYAKANGWVVGYPDNTFKPGDPVNKVEALKMLLEVFEAELITITADPYMDVSGTEWFAKYVTTAKTIGLLEETGLYYYPANNITRGQISENIYRLLLIGDNYEKIAFIAATVETACLTDGFNIDQPDEAMLNAIMDIYEKYGFPVDNDPAMNELFAKYENDEEIALAIAVGVQDQCPEVMDNILSNY